MDRRIIYIKFRDIKLNTEIFSSLSFSYSTDNYGCPDDSVDDNTYMEKFYDGNRKKRLLEYSDRISSLIHGEHYGNAVEEP
ncbi:MAG: hypothetical protein GX288_07915 [Clostridiales bacterium]|nr:hypothetical protein [Clostridiales bacterium]